MNIIPESSIGHLIHRKLKFPVIEVSFLSTIRIPLRFPFCLVVELIDFGLPCR